MGGFCEVIWKFSFRSLLIHISLDWHNLLMLNALYYSYASILCWQFSRRKFRLYKQLPPCTEEGGICQIFSPWHTKGSYISKLVDSKWNSLNPILNHHQVNILWLFITAPKTPLRGSGWKLLELSLVWAFLDQNKSITTANQSLVISKEGSENSNFLKRGKTPSTKTPLVLVWYQIGSDRGVRFPDQSQSKARNTKLELSKISFYHQSAILINPLYNHQNMLYSVFSQEKTNGAKAMRRHGWGESELKRREKGEIRLISNTKAIFSYKWLKDFLWVFDCVPL